ncbi:MAG TPA: DUF3619 family protein [Noviherbaspirillum sp.]|nr:DUF3619 family protein [Noviherbaspirillum sp.]
MNKQQELNFAYKLRHALNESLDDVPTSIAEKLASSRKIALSRKKKENPLAFFVPGRLLAGHVGTFSNVRLSWLNRMGLAVPMVVLALGLTAIYQFEQERRINDTAEIDVAVLADDLPLSAYVDHGFNAYLAERDD